MGGHPIRCGPEQNKRQRKEESNLPLSAPTVELGHLIASPALMLGFTPPAFLGLQLADGRSWDCGTSQPP